MNNQWAYLVVICLSMQCEGAIASILPTTTLSVFGMKRGHLVYSFMFSAFGVSALLGGVCVKLLQDLIGYPGMFVLCFIQTLVAGGLTYKYGDMKFDYVLAMGDRMKEFNAPLDVDTEEKPIKNKEE